MAEETTTETATKVELKGGNLVITMPVAKNPKASKSGKSLTVATTSGIMATEIKIKGKTLKLGVNAFISAD